MMTVCIALCALTSALLVYGMLVRGRYKEYLKPLNRSDYNWLDLMPVGLAIQELMLGVSRHRADQTKDAALRRKVATLYGEAQLSRYLIILEAYRIASGLMMVWLFSLIGCCAGAGELCLAGVVLGVLMYYTGKTKPDTLLKERQKQIQLEFPDFMSKFVLLLGSNMTVTKAWQLVTDGVGNTPLGREIQITAREMHAGTTAADALNGFARRVRNTEVSRFVSSVVQNIDQGGENLASVLESQLNESWTARKQTALRLGQEATTKLVFPMVLMFVSVLLLMLAPAIMSLKDGF